MKIGTSLGKCVKDILDGHVRYEDVFFIVTNTNCPTLKHLLGVIEEYYYDNKGATGRGAAYDLSAHSLSTACAIAQRLMEDGKLHQPRCVATGMYGSARNSHDLQDTWYDIVPSPTSESESVREAWNHYTMIRKLAA
jgi:hypothetical protein